ncbi:MAG: hypothetical protein RLY93_16925 [Sumerlaeia bacterium]
MPRWTFALFALCGLLLMTGGCAYKDPLKVLSTRDKYETIPLRVGIYEFSDERPLDTLKSPRNYDTPLFLWSSYRYPRPDEIRRTDAMEQMLARDFADRLKTANTFQEVQYLNQTIENPPAPSDYDLLIYGKLRDTTSKGVRSAYGLALIGRYLWFLGLPNETESYDYKADLQLIDGYTMAPIGDPITVEGDTGARILTRYANRKKMKFARRNANELWDRFLVEFRDEYPAGNAELWDNLKNSGLAVLREEALETQRQARGKAPTIVFNSPADGSQFRTPSTTVQWSAEAPNAMRQVSLFVNNVPMDIGLPTSSMANESSAPRSIPANRVTANLRLGANTVKAQVVDYRDMMTVEELTLYRIPKALNPVSRHALVIGGGSSAAQATAQQLSSTLTNPAVGQFPAGNVSTVIQSGLDAAALRSAIANFGRAPLANELALIYIAAPGDSRTLTVGGANGLTLEELAMEVRRSLATEDVVLILDIAWDRARGGIGVLDSMGQLPQRWAVTTATSDVAPAPANGGRHTFGTVLDDVLQGRAGSGGNTLTLDGWLQQSLTETDRRAPQAQPDLQGRYSSTVTMAERQ